MKNPLLQNSDSTRVVRGGAWHNDPNYLRSARRFKIPPAIRGNNIGFRLFRTLAKS